LAITKVRVKLGDTWTQLTLNVEDTVKAMLGT